ncbi:MAG: TonB-dependent receptor plug domain-containing protein [Eggerthellaceae bacterium]|nr:TonB-dependent receptor plug domain-containing protein [Eggerthellaceae bacterium]
MKAIGVGLGMACMAPMYAFAADAASPSTMQTSEPKPQETAKANAPATDSAMQKSVDKSAEEKATLGTIEVTGIVGSLDRALNLKRTNTTIVDAISAEDVGKFPDTNLAESLQRITGVQMTRDSNGEGQYVSVRGLPTDFTLATYNGMTMPTVDLANGGANGEQNRTFNYNVISPDFLSSLEVYKGSRADLDEGGIGATVDLRTVTPFGIGKEKFLLSAKEQGSPGKTGNRNYPDITALYSNIFADGTFGLTVGFDWNKRYFANTVADGDYGSYATISSIDGKQGPFY